MMRSFLLLAVLAALLPADDAWAASLDLRFNPRTGLQEDEKYPGISTASAGVSNLPGLFATLTGRGYGVEQTGEHRWGIVAGPLEWDRQLNGWTVRNGFAPDKTGSMMSTTGSNEVEASYLSLMLSGVTEGTLFKEVALTFTDVAFLRPAHAWAGTSADGFASAAKVKHTASRGVQQLSVSLPEFTWSGGDPLEIRIYGIIGSDEGAFNVLSVTGQAIPPARVPEPSSVFLLSGVILGMSARRRRRCRTPGP